MAGRIKHMERSHKTASKNYSQYRRFVIKASAKSEKKVQEKSLVQKIKALFHRTTSK